MKRILKSKIKSNKLTSLFKLEAKASTKKERSKKAKFFHKVKKRYQNENPTLIL
jgi:hypothetical protein